MRLNRRINLVTIFFLCILLTPFIYSGNVFSQSELSGSATDNKEAGTEDVQVPSDVPVDMREGVKAEEKVIDYVNIEIDYLESGIASLREGNYEEAVQELRMARSQSPESSLAAYYLGVSYKKVQNYSEAKVHLKDAVRLRPPVKEAIVELADAFYQLGEMNDALQTLTIAELEGIESAQTRFLKGLVLLKLGGGKASIGYFEKAKSMDQRYTQSADYQIALANIQEGNLVKAREILREIVIRDPNTDMAQYANQYIDAITKRLKEESPLRFFAGIQYQYDDNVILKPGDASVAGDITNEADSLTAVTLRAEYTPKLKGPYGLKTQYSMYFAGYHDLSSYDVQSHTISLVPNYNLRQGQLSLLTSFNYTMVDDYKYLKTLTLSPAYMHLISDTQFVQASVKYLHKEYQMPPINSDEDRDSGDAGFGASWYYLLAGGKGFINARYDFNSENADGINWAYKGNKIGAGLLYPLMERLKLNIGGEDYLQDFDNVHTVFGSNRKDTIFTLYSLLTYALSDKIDISARYVFVNGDSNIALYDYDKSTITLGIEARLP